MKKSAILRPVSQKAYARFVERISIVVTDSVKREAMLTALDSYLDGNRETYDNSLSPDCAMVFEMLRFEIELAIARSAKARTRTRAPRKPAGDKADDRAITAHQQAKDSGPAEDDTINITPRVSRRMRRAVDRIARTKTRWRKLG